MISDTENPVTNCFIMKLWLAVLQHRHSDCQKEEGKPSTKIKEGQMYIAEKYFMLQYLMSIKANENS